MRSERFPAEEEGVSKVGSGGKRGRELLALRGSGKLGCPFSGYTVPL